MQSPSNDGSRIIANFVNSTTGGKRIDLEFQT